MRYAVIDVARPVKTCDVRIMLRNEEIRGSFDASVCFI